MRVDLPGFSAALSQVVGSRAAGARRIALANVCVEPRSVDARLRQSFEALVNGGLGGGDRSGGGEVRSVTFARGMRAREAFHMVQLTPHFGALFGPGVYLHCDNKASE